MFRREYGLYAGLAQAVSNTVYSIVSDYSIIIVILSRFCLEERFQNVTKTNYANYESNLLVECYFN